MRWSRGLPGGRTRRVSACAALVLACTLATALPAAHGATPAAKPFARERAFAVRPFRPLLGERWIGNAIAYGPHRDGQRPGGPSPTREQLREDLRLMSRYWGLFRVYGSVGPAETILDLIREEQLPMRVVLGVWIAPESTPPAPGARPVPNPANAAANRAEIEAAVRLAAAHPATVAAIAVGNETQIFWSAHRSPEARLIRAIREVRARTTVPVTVADDFNFWNKPASRRVAREIDFLTMHAHPLWNGRQLDEAVAWTTAQYDSVRALHRDREVVIGETGWATQRLFTGEQGKLMKAPADEASQKVFCDAMTAWAARERVTVFLFEAFDENWKGGPDPGEVEKHWGLFRADRSPKPVMEGR